MTEAARPTRAVLPVSLISSMVRNALPLKLWRRPSVCPTSCVAVSFSPCRSSFLRSALVAGLPAGARTAAPKANWRAIPSASRQQHER